MCLARSPRLAGAGRRGQGSSGGGGNSAEPIGNLAEAKTVKQATKSARAGTSTVSETVAGLDQPTMARLRGQN
jgi:hypothetical protein